MRDMSVDAFSLLFTFILKQKIIHVYHRFRSFLLYKIRNSENIIQQAMLSPKDSKKQKTKQGFITHQYSSTIHACSSLFFASSLYFASFLLVPPSHCDLSVSLCVALSVCSPSAKFVNGGVLD